MCRLAGQVVSRRSISDYLILEVIVKRGGNEKINVKVTNKDKVLR